MHAVQPSFCGEALPKIHTVGLSIPPPKNTFGGGAPFPIPTYGHLPIPFLGEAVEPLPIPYHPPLFSSRIWSVDGQLTLRSPKTQKWATDPQGPKTQKWEIDPKWAQIWGCFLHPHFLNFVSGELPTDRPYPGTYYSFIVR